MIGRLVILLAMCVAGASAESRRRRHDNEVNFAGASSIAWKEDKHSITGGQPWDGITTSGSTIDIKAGRHGSSGPAADFTDGLEIVNMMGLKTAWPHITTAPADLNFATFGTLSVTFPSGKSKECSGIRLGQGHHGSDNNWWIAGKSCLTVPDSNVFTCRTLLGNCHISFHAGDNDHEFQIRDPNEAGANVTIVSI